MTPVNMLLFVVADKLIEEVIIRYFTADCSADETREDDAARSKENKETCVVSGRPR